MEIQSVSFHKGINSDLDRIYLDGTTYIDLVNGELESISDNRFIVKNSKGTSIFFNLTSGFTPLAFCAISNKLFILSINNSNVCELGFYSLITESYIPFNNYKLTQKGARISFNSNLFGYTKSSKVKMIGKVFYDGSVNLYLCDGVNPNYVINSGIDYNEVANEIVYTPDSFYGRLRQFSGTKAIPLVDSSLSYIKDGGNLKPGSYMVFIRYSDEKYNKTPFIGYSSAFLVSNGDDSNFSAVPLSDNDVSTTNKLLSLTITGIDTDYKYLELAYLRYFGLTGSVSYEVREIADRIEINGNSTINIAITGNEKSATVTLENLYEEIPQTQTCNDHEIINDHYWGVGWKKKKRDGLITKDFFKRIVVNPYFDTSESANLSKGIGTEFSKKTGYFAEQIYQFVGFFVYNDMSRSDVYPLSGYYNSSARIYNNSGYVKMPRRTNVTGAPLSVKFSLTDSDGSSYFYDHRSIPRTALEFFNDNIDSNELKDVKYIQFMRSKRVENLLYQGILAPTTFRFIEKNNLYDRGSLTPTINGLSFNGVSYASFNHSGAEGTFKKYLGKALAPQTYSGAYHYPFFSGIAPGISKESKSAAPFCFISNHAEDQTEKSRYALFSPDFMFNSVSKINSGQQLWFEEVFNVNNDNGTIVYSDYATGRVFPQVVGSKMAPTVISGTRNSGKVVAYPIDEDTDTGPGNFISRIRDYFAVGKFSNESSIYAEVYFWLKGYDSTTTICSLRSNRCPKYIGIEMVNETYGESFLVQKHRYVNIYLSENNEAFYNNVKAKNPLNEEYYLIATPIPISLFSTIGNLLMYSGDCFYGFTRFLYNKSFEFGGSDIEADVYGYDELADTDNEMFSDSVPDNKYHFGIVCQILTENEINHNARCVSKEKTFFDAKGLSIDSAADLSSFVKGNNKFVSIESYLNYGGLSMVSPIFKVGSSRPISDFDEDSMISSIVVSEKQVADAVSDSFKNISFKKVKSFATELGGMVAIKSFNQNVFVIHKHGVTLHQSLLELKQSTEGNPISVAQGEILPDKFAISNSYGSNGFNLVCSTNNAVYGIDLNKQSLWIAYIDESGLIQSNMADLFNARKFIETVKDGELLIDGMAFYDKNRKSILFSLVNSNDYKNTLFFNEDIKAFSKRIEYASRLSVGFINELLSVPYESSISSNSIWKHNSDLISDLQNFYGEKKMFKFVFVMNGNNSQTNFARIPKIHESLHIISNREPFSAIKFCTEEQEGVYAVFYDESRQDFWNNPIWGENGWHVPVLVQTETKNPNVGPILPNPWPVEIYGYDPKARQRGMWLLVELSYGGLGGEKEIYIKGVDSRFNISTL